MNPSQHATITKRITLDEILAAFDYPIPRRVRRKPGVGFWSEFEEWGFCAGPFFAVALVLALFVPDARPYAAVGAIVFGALAGPYFIGHGLGYFLQSRRDRSLVRTGTAVMGTVTSFLIKQLPDFGNEYVVEYEFMTRSGERCTGKREGPFIYRGAPLPFRKTPFKLAVGDPVVIVYRANRTNDHEPFENLCYYVSE